MPAIRVGASPDDAHPVLCTEVTGKTAVPAARDNQEIAPADRRIFARHVVARDGFDRDRISARAEDVTQAKVCLGIPPPRPIDPRGGCAGQFDPHKRFAARYNVAGQYLPSYPRWGVGASEEQYTRSR